MKGFRMPCSQNIITVIKPRRMRWIEHVACIKGMRNADKIFLSENLKGRDHLENLCVGGKITEWILGK
jgi:hypothetical protein